MSLFNMKGITAEKHIVEIYNYFVNDQGNTPVKDSSLNIIFTLDEEGIEYP